MKSVTNTDMRKFCSLHKFLELHDKQLFNIFENMCMFSILRPRAANGITLLRPNDKYKQEIASIVFGDSPENAIPIIQSLVIHKYLPNTTSWSTESSLYNAFKMPIKFKSAAGNKVVINIMDAAKKPVEITLVKNPEFISFSNRTNMAIWDIEGAARIPTDGEKVEVVRKSAPAGAKPVKSEFAKVTKGKGARWGPKRGGAINAESIERDSMADCLYKKFSIKTAANKRMSRCYLKPVVSFLLWAQVQRPAEFAKLASIVDWCPEVTFFLIFEPYSNSHVHISDETFNAWLDETRGKCSCIKSEVAMRYVQLMEVLSKDVNSGENVLAERKRIQDELMSPDNANRFKSNMADYVFKNVYKSDARRAFCDEFRFMLFRVLKDICDSIKNDPVGSQALMTSFLTYSKLLYGIFPETGSNSSVKLMLMNQKIQNDTDTQAWFSGFRCFVRSSDFLHVLRPLAALKASTDSKMCNCKEELADSVRTDMSTIALEMLLHNSAHVRVDSSSALAALDAKVPLSSIRNMM